MRRGLGRSLAHRTSGLLIFLELIMAKEFKTIDELIEIMESRGIVVDELTKPAIMRESYYAIVNGYKRPFLDTAKMESTSEDAFLEGTRFEWVYKLFLFDRDLRNVTFKYLSKAEAIMKTSVVYAFCEAHPEHDAYLQRSAYVDAKNMLLPKGFKGNRGRKYSNDMSRLMETINSKLSDSPTRKPFVTHYINKHGSVPLWVLSNDLTFGNMAHFYQLQTRSVQNRTCKLVLEANGWLEKGFRISPLELLHAFSVLSEFRNLCAHDDRLYCAKVGRSGDIDYSKMALQLFRIISEDDFDRFIDDIGGLFGKYGDDLHVVTPKSLLKDMGFRSPDDEAGESEPKN